MPHKVIWFSEKADDPLKSMEVVQAADEYCETNEIRFPLLVNLALRSYLGLEGLSEDAIEQAKLPPRALTDEEKTERRKQYTKKYLERRKAHRLALEERLRELEKEAGVPPEESFFKDKPADDEDEEDIGGDISEEANQ